MLRPLIRPIVRPLVRGVTEPGYGSLAAQIRLLFAAGEQGAWYDPSDLASMNTKHDGSGAVPGVGDPVGYIADKSGRGNHAKQTTDTARPTLQADANGRYYLQFDGVDDELSALVSLSSFPLYIVAGGKSDVDAVGTLISAFEGAPPYYDVAKDAVANRWSAVLREAAGARPSSETVGTNAEPHVFVGVFAEDSANLRMDGIDANSATTFAAVPFGTTTKIRIGNGGIGKLNGRFYSGVVRNALSTAAQIAAAERYAAAKTGVTLA